MSTPEERKAEIKRGMLKYPLGSIVFNKLKSQYTNFIKAKNKALKDAKKRT